MIARLMLVLLTGLAASASAETLRFQADNWVAECGAASDCSIIGVLNRANPGPEGTFSLFDICGIISWPSSVNHPRAGPQSVSTRTQQWSAKAIAIAFSRRATQKR